MAEVNVQNILVGYGDLFYAENWSGGTKVEPAPTADETGTVYQDLDTATSPREAFDAHADWTYLGATQEGVELAYAPEYGEVEVDQLGDAAVMFFERASVTLNTQLAEATLENLLIAWGFEDSFLEQATSTDTFSLGIPGSDPVERSIGVVGKGAAYNSGTESEPVWERRDRVYLGRRVLSIEGSTLALRRSENTAFPVTMRLLADPTFVDSEYGQIIDIVPGSGAAS